MTSRLLVHAAKYAGSLPRSLARGMVPVGAAVSPFQLTVAMGYHSSAPVARKNGSRALEPKFRPPSKKQMKRRTRQVERESKIVDYKKDKLKKQHIRDQFNSEEMQAFIHDLRERLHDPIGEVMLPDGLNAQSQARPALPDVDPTAVMLQLASYLDDSGNQTTSKELMDPSAGRDANRALLWYAEKGKVQEAMHMYNVMNALSLPVETAVVAPLIRAATKKSDFEAADNLFNEVLMDDSKDVNLDMWAAKINNLAKQKDAEGAEKILNDLIAMKLTPLPCMYTAVLGALVHTKQLEKAYDMWMRMHHEDVEIELDAFHHMFDHCLMNNNGERAFNFWDEMAVYNLQPSHLTFNKFIRAVGVAPHFIPGFQDILFDAMALVEGQETVPNALVYEAIILGFSKARDPVAAEYYFWEMKRKGIAPTPAVYTALLESFYMAQVVGAGKYGRLGRYSKPDDLPLTQDQQDLVDLGPVRVNKIMNANVHTDYIPEPHEKRTKHPKFVDAFDEEDEEDQSGDVMDSHERFMQQVRYEAAQLRASRAAARQELDSRRDAAQLGAGRDRALALEAGAKARAGDAGKFLDDVDLEEVAEGDEEMLEFLEMMKSDDTGTFDDVAIDGMTFRKAPKRGAAGETKLATPSLREEVLDRKKQAQLAREKIYNMEETEFTDPFAHMDGLRGTLQAETAEEKAARLEREQAARRLSGVTMLDNAGVAAPTRRVMSALAKTEDSDPYSQLDAFDAHPGRLGPVTDDEVDRSFDLVYFGRAPDADYSLNILDRRRGHIHRAELVFQDMINNGLRPTPRALLNLLGVHCECPYNHEGADSVLARYAEYNILPEPHTFRLLVKMHIRNRDAGKAMEVYEGMLRNNIVPDRETYGLLIVTHTHRGKVVEALKILEDAASKSVEIPEKYMKILRGRCTNLGVRHPDIPPDPLLWVKESKQVRKNMKLASQRYIEPVRSLTFN